jgi:hypothetical protein
LSIFANQLLLRGSVIALREGAKPVQEREALGVRRGVLETSDKDLFPLWLRDARDKALQQGVQRPSSGEADESARSILKLRLDL